MTAVPLAETWARQIAFCDAGARATREAPLAWLSFEVVGADADCELALTLWPGGARRVLAAAHPHGRWVRWLP